MQNSSIANNIIKTVISCSSKKNIKINIMYDGSSYLFDKIISQIEDLIVIPNQNNNTSDFISYDLFISGDPISVSTNISNILSTHINSIVYFHNYCPNNFKKEDKFLLKQSLSRVYKIFPNQGIMDSWSFEKSDTTRVIQYGVPNNDHAIEKTRSVVVLNTSKNPSINSLYKYISNTYKDAIIIDDPVSLDHLQKILLQSMVCIESESIFNIMMCISLGCNVVSSIKDINEDGLININSYEKINDIIQQTINQYSTDTANNYKKTLIEKYNFDKFKNELVSFMKDIIKEPYIYAKSS